MEIMEEYKVSRIINEEPEFCEGQQSNLMADYFVLCEEGNCLFDKNIYDLNICGMKILNWVVRVCATQPKVLNFTSLNVI